MKKETLEEAADNWVRKPIIGTRRKSFIAGANWQAEKDKNKYSDEEVRQIATWSFHFYKTNEFTDSELEDEWYKLLEKKFKNK